MADPVSLGLSTVAQIGVSYLFPSKGPRMTDLKISSSTYGAYIPKTFGTCRVAGNVIWADKIREKKHTVGKGGAQQTYTYSCSLAVAFCQGPITTLRRLWADGKLILDRTGQSEASNISGLNFTVYMGDEEQLPNSLIESYVGAGNVPAYRGMCYIVFDAMPLKDFGNRIPQFTAEVFKDDGQVGAGIATNMRIKDGSSYSYQGNTRVVDAVRGYAYLVSDGGIRRFRLSDGLQDKYITGPEIGTAQESVANILAVDPRTGVLLVNSSITNYSAIYALDPVSLNVVGKQGSDSTFQQDGPTNWPYAVGGGVDSSGTFYFNTLFGEIYKTQLVTAPPYIQAGAGITTYVGGSGSLYHPMHVVIPSNRSGYVWGTGGYSDGTPETQVSIHGTVNYTISLPPGYTSGMSLDGLLWDAGTDGLIVIFTNPLGQYICKIDAASQQMVWITKGPTDVGLTGVYGRSGSISNGRLTILADRVNAGRLYTIDTVTGEWLPHDPDRPIIITSDSETPNEVTTAIPYTSIPGVWDDGGYQYYDSLRDQLMVLGSPNRLVKLGEGLPEVSLGGVLSDMLRYGGMTSQNFDMSELDDVNIAGYGWARSTDIKGIVEELCRVFSCDIVESEGKLIGKKREGATTVYTIPQNVLASTSPEANDFWVETRAQEADLPSQIALGFMNVNDDYQSSVAHTQRISAPYSTVNSRQQVSMDVSIVFTPSEAKTRARQMLYAQWAERTAHTTRLPWAYMDLDPADLITVEMNDGRSYNDRIHSLEIGADFTMATNSLGQDSGAYELTAVGDGGTGSYAPPTITIPVEAMPIVINSPLLRDQDDTNGSYSLYYAGIAGRSASAFVGGSMYRSLNALDYPFLFGTESEVTWGSVSGILPPPTRGDFALDWINTVTVWPGSSNFELQSISEDELWNGGNPCWIGGEILQFRDCIENGNGSWTLFNLLRGRRGTEYAASSHIKGEVFVFLDSVGLSFQGDTIDSRGQSRFYKAIGDGASLENAQVLKLAYEPRDLMPYAPTDIRRTIAGGTITLDWSRRSRTGGEMRDSTGDVPLREVSEKYEVYFLADPFDGDLSRGNAPETYLAKFEVTSPTVSWTPGGLMDPILDTLHVCVYQLSAAVGRGFPGTRSIEPWDDF